MKRALLLVWVAALLLVLSPAKPGATQSQIPEIDQIAGYLSQHPILIESNTRVLDVFAMGEALVIDLSQEILPEGRYDPEIFNSLQADLDKTFQVNQFFMVTFKIEGQTLDHWGQPLPAFEKKASPEEFPSATAEGPLSGVRIALSPGHGLYWSEYFGDWRYQRIEFWGIREDTLNVQFMRYLQAALLNQGATVIQTRELDLKARAGVTGYPAWHESARQYAIAEGLPSWIYNGGSNNYNSDIRTRPYMANDYGADILISFHNNGWDGSLRGTETYYDTNNHPGSPVLANYVHNEIIKTIRAEYDPNWTDRKVKSSDDNYGEINYAQMPAILIELAFMDNYQDNQALQNENFKILAAEAITRGICKFRGVTCEDVNITLPVTLETPILSPGFGDGMCDSGWNSYTNSRGSNAFLMRNAHTVTHSTNMAIWRPTLPVSGAYRIEAYLPAHGPVAWQCPDSTIPSDSIQAVYEIEHVNGKTTQTVNQASSIGTWVDLGLFHYNDDTLARVRLRDLTLEYQATTNVSASAMRFTLVGQAGTPFHNTGWAHTSWPTDQIYTSTDRIRNFFRFYHSCLAEPLQDTDGLTIDIPQLILEGAATSQINPTLLLGLMEAQSQAISRCPDSAALGNLMGLAEPDTGREQIATAARQLRAAWDALILDGVSPNGWAAGEPKTTLDGVNVIPANNTIALLMDYSPYAGGNWGGNLPDEPGAQAVFLALRDYHLETLSLPVLVR